MHSTEVRYPISEIFVSPQGEGLYAGTLMTFIRLAGCSVGKPFPKERYQEKYSSDAYERPLHLPIYTEMCTLYDGRTFACDTDYRVRQRMTVDEILDQVESGTERICITGGEPLIHDLHPLVERAIEYQHTVHVETSGSKLIPSWMYDLMEQGDVWITVSPKADWLPSTIKFCNELKFLVDENFDLAAMRKVANFAEDDCIIWIQPVNHEHKINEENMKRCLELQKQHPALRISSQSHKLWNVR